jgi:hypothetical protein
MSDSYNWNSIRDHGIEARRSDEERFVGHIILGFLAVTALYFALGIVRALLS